MYFSTVSSVFRFQVYQAEVDAEDPQLVLESFILLQVPYIADVVFVSKLSMLLSILSQGIIEFSSYMEPCLHMV